MSKGLLDGIAATFQHNPLNPVEHPEFTDLVKDSF
jgi:hypothetical protein